MGLGKPARYARVTAPIETFVKVATYPSNTYVGSSQAWGNVYERVTLEPGDLVADLPGGLFAKRGDQWYETRLELSDKHLFEKVYVPREPATWPVEAVEEIEKQSLAPRFEVAQATAAWVYGHANAYGRSIDYVLSQGEGKP